MTTGPVTAGVRKCQDLPALEEGGEDEYLSFSPWSPSSADAGAAELLLETETHFGTLRNIFLMCHFSFLFLCGTGKRKSLFFTIL